MGREKSELPNPSAGDSGRQRSGGEVLKEKGPHKQLRGTTTGSSLLLLDGMQQWSEALRQARVLRRKAGQQLLFLSFPGFVFASFHS